MRLNEERTLVLLMASNIVAGIPRQTSPDYQINLALEMATRMTRRYSEMLAKESDAAQTET
jgi:hypothetical protein